MEITGTCGKMSRANIHWNGEHGKWLTENQCKKRIIKCKHYGKEQGAKVLRWNKKKGVREKSRKHSRVVEWMY